MSSYQASVRRCIKALLNEGVLVNDAFMFPGDVQHLLEMRGEYPCQEEWDKLTSPDERSLLIECFHQNNDKWNRVVEVVFGILPRELKVKTTEEEVEDILKELGSLEKTK